jgi:hypothetical protein
LPVCLHSPPRLFQSLSAMSYAAGSVSGLTKAVTKSDAEQVRKNYLKLAKHDNRARMRLACFLPLFSYFSFVYV